MVVSANRYVRNDQIIEFVRKTAPRIIKRLDSQSRIKVQRFIPDEIKCGETIKFFGIDHILDIKPGIKQEMSIKSGRMIMQLPSSDVISNVPFSMFDTMRSEYANTFFIKRLHEISKVICPGISPDLKVRKMKARFGTCYPDRKLIVLNLFLIHTDLSCIDYVIIHELIHLDVPNHSRQFYSMLSLYYPDWRRQKVILKEFAPYLRELS